MSSTFCLGLWDAVLPVPTPLSLSGSQSWMKPGRWSPKSEALRCWRNTTVVTQIFLIGGTHFTWGFFFVFFRITSTVLRSGWSSPADTSQWESRAKKNRCHVVYYVDLNSSPLVCSQKREVNTILADIIKHMTPDRAFEDAYPQVSSSFAHTLFILKWTCSSSLHLWFCSCSQQSGRSSYTSTTSLSCSQLWVGPSDLRRLNAFLLKDGSKVFFNVAFFPVPPGAFPAVSWHVPEGQCKSGGLQIHHGCLPQVRDGRL